MKSKDITIVIVVAVVAAIIASILTVVVMNKINPSLSPGPNDYLTVSQLQYYLPQYFYPKNSSGDLAILGSVNFPISNAAIEVNTKVSALGFEQTFAESESSKGSISLGGDNFVIERTGNGWSQKSILSPGSISMTEEGVHSSMLSTEYLQFCDTSTCIYCFPNFASRTLDCRQ